MEATELMIGDLARVSKDVCFKKGTIVEIRGIDADNAFAQMGLKGSVTCVDVNDPDRVSGGVWCGYLEPILLSGEILERSGWMRVILTCLNYVLSDDFYDITAHEFSDNMWHVEYDCTEMGGIPSESVNICWLHELQHFLAHHGIDTEIKLED